MSDINSYYQSHYIASVAIENGQLRVLGGPKEKRLLKQAKRETDTCYVRNVPDNCGVKLTLVRGDWAISDPT